MAPLYDGTSSDHGAYVPPLRSRLIEFAKDIYSEARPMYWVALALVIVLAAV